ncbi:MAG: hypothetical protein KIG84_05100, partial [Bacteroidales bacterium]|nr:hypothetical protein [Bacteroidales bacterium]
FFPGVGVFWLCLPNYPGLRLFAYFFNIFLFITPASGFAPPGPRHLLMYIYEKKLFVIYRSFYFMP